MNWTDQKSAILRSKVRYKTPKVVLEELEVFSGSSGFTLLQLLLL